MPCPCDQSSDQSSTSLLSIGFLSGDGTRTLLSAADADAEIFSTDINAQKEQVRLRDALAQRCHQQGCGDSLFITCVLKPIPHHSDHVLVQVAALEEDMLASTLALPGRRLPSWRWRLAYSLALHCITCMAYGSLFAARRATLPACLLPPSPSTRGAVRCTLRVRLAVDTASAFVISPYTTPACTMHILPVDDKLAVACSTHRAAVYIVLHGRLTLARSSACAAHAAPLRPVSCGASSGFV